MKIVGLDVAISQSMNDNLSDDSRLWEMEAFYIRISLVLVFRKVPVREKFYLKTMQKWASTSSLYAWSANFWIDRGNQWHLIAYCDLRLMTCASDFQFNIKDYFVFFHFHIISKKPPCNIISHILNKYPITDVFILVPETAA